SMNSEEEICEKLDAELDGYITAMKPYVLNLQDCSERRICTMWIKKLCRPSGAGVGIEGRKNRNSYAKLLLHMLKRGVLDCPFTHKPEQGLLKSLPSYLLTYLKELSSPAVPSTNSGCLPEWRLGRIENSTAAEGTFLSTALIQGDHATVRKCSVGMAKPIRSFIFNYVSASSSDILFDFFLFQGDQHKNPVSVGDSDLEARLTSWNLGLENPRYLREKPVPMSLMTPKIGPGKGSPSRDQQAQFRSHDKQLEMEMKMAIAEGKFHEEKLKLQQKHDVEIQKILGRKNDEIEMLKSTYEKKQKESEEMIRKLEKKVEILVRESQVVREAKEEQIEELKNLCEKSSETLKNEWEKRV
ncbi:CE112 protein, partial [Smithornis capensis]|nr:CE112 protein [Smithornis capensis]